jgi:hypothetical protein
MAFSGKKPKQTLEKTNKVTKRHELIFYHAVALQQSGRLRSSIHCRGSKIFILNQDNTVLLRFTLGKKHFQKPFSFNANDYESNQFTVEGEHIIFHIQHGKYQRDKACRVSNINNKDVMLMFKKQTASVKKENAIVLDKDFLKCLDSDLNHLEFKGHKNKLICRQRNLYTGTVVTVTVTDTKKKKGLFTTKPVQNFPATGIRTADFLSLFSFTDVLTFYFAGDNVFYFENKDTKMPFTGVISRCTYDEIGVDKDGR